MQVEYKIEPLTKERLKERFQNNFAPNYMTLISVVQGLALSILVTNAFAAFKDKNTPLQFLIYPVLSFFCIVMVFFLYNWFWSITYTPPNFRETLIPLVLGVSEVLPMYYFDQPKYWWFSFGIFSVWSIVALHNTVRGLKKEHFSDDLQDTFRLCVREEYWNIFFCLGIAVIAGIAFFTYPSQSVYAGPTWRDWIYGGATLCLAMIMAWKSQFHYLNKVYTNCGLMPR